MFAVSPSCLLVSRPSTLKTLRNRPAAVRLPLVVSAKRSVQPDQIRRRDVGALLASWGLCWAIGAPSAHAGNATGSGVDDDESPLIQALLKSSKENKAKYDKERLDDYYKRNFTDYFEFVVGVEDPGGPTETQKKMREFINANKDN